MRGIYIVAEPSIFGERFDSFVDALDISCGGRMMQMIVIFGSHLLLVMRYCEVVDQLLIMIHQRRMDNDSKDVDLRKVPKPVVNEPPSTTQLLLDASIISMRCASQLPPWQVKILDPTRWK
jgi:hypothetical protein